MKWCSNCKVIYSDDYSICTDCGTPLVEETPPKPENPKISDKLIEAYKEKNARIESEIMNAKREIHIPRGEDILWIAALAYFPICYILARIFNRIVSVIMDMSFFELGMSMYRFVFPLLLYAIIFALFFAFIRYFFQMDEKPYSYFSKKNILIIAIVSFLFKVFAEPIIRQVTSLVYPFYDMNMPLYIIAFLLGEVAGIVFLAIALVFIWKLTFKMPQRVYTLFKSAYWNACGAIASAILLLLIAISALLSYLSWGSYFDFSHGSLMYFVDILTGGAEFFPIFEPFRIYASLLLCMIPIFYQYMRQNKQGDEVH